MAERQFKKETKDLVRVKINTGPDFRGRVIPQFGVCRPVLRILTLFQTKKISFVTPAVSDLAYKKLFHHGLRLDSPAAIKKIS